MTTNSKEIILNNKDLRRIKGGNCLTTTLNNDGDIVFNVDTDTINAVAAAKIEFQQNNDKKTYLLGVANTSSPQQPNCNSNVYIQNGSVYASYFSGNGSNLTNLDIAKITSNVEDGENNPYYKIRYRQNNDGSYELIDGDLTAYPHIAVLNSKFSIWSRMSGVAIAADRLTKQLYLHSVFCIVANAPIWFCVSIVSTTSTQLTQYYQLAHELEKVMSVSQNKRRVIVTGAYNSKYPIISAYYNRNREMSFDYCNGTSDDMDHYTAPNNDIHINDDSVTKYYPI